MGRGSEDPSKRWADRIPEAVWPEAMVSAIRHDVGALATPRVIETLRRWRADLAQTEDQAKRRLAKQRLRAIGHALIEADDELPTRMSEDLNAEALEPDTDSAVRAYRADDDANANPFVPPSRRLSTKPRPVLKAADEARAGERSRRKKAFNQLGEAAVEAPQEGPTRFAPEVATTALPAAPQETMNTPPIVAAYQVEAPRSFEDGSEHPTRAVPIPTPTSERQMPQRRDSSEARPSAKQPTAPPPPPAPSGIHPSAAHVPLAPKPGVVQRSGLSSPAEPPRRPRASILQVRALYRAIIGFCEELAPLSYERRSRRFWAHWREVSGDRGVRRTLVEETLGSAEDARDIANALIAEVQSVDPDSVRDLLLKIEAEGPDDDPIEAPVVARQEHGRGALMGASVKVEGLPASAEPGD